MANTVILPFMISFIANDFFTNSFQKLSGRRQNFFRVCIGFLLALTLTATNVDELPLTTANDITNIHVTKGDTTYKISTRGDVWINIKPDGEIRIETLSKNLPTL